MRKAIFYFVLNVFTLILNAQNSSELIKDMSWGIDLKVHLKLQNDSVYIYDMEKLYHANSAAELGGFTYYPVNPSTAFMEELRNKGVELGIDTSGEDTTKCLVMTTDKTLWSAIHSYIGGGWIHFVNTMLFTIETGSLSLKSPLMKRPESKWKPNPMTESFKRTKDWAYYTPTTQKEAIKEFTIRREANQLGDLSFLPEKFLKTFLETDDKEYKEMMREQQWAEIARIDLIRLLLGSNYLGKIQIRYIKSMVLKSVTQYSRNSLPSVILFDDFKAAVAMTLDNSGYHIERIVFSDQDDVSRYDLDLRIRTIENLVNTINEVNKQMFIEKLRLHYN